MLDPRGTAQAHIPRRQGMSSFIAINVGAGGGGRHTGCFMCDCVSYVRFVSDSYCVGLPVRSACGAALGLAGGRESGLGNPPTYTTVKIRNVTMTRLTFE